MAASLPSHVTCWGAMHIQGGPMHLQMHWKCALDGSDPVHLLQVSPEGQSPPPKVPKSMSRYPSNGGSMGTLTTDCLQGIRGQHHHLGLRSEFIENESRGPIL